MWAHEACASDLAAEREALLQQHGEQAEQLRLQAHARRAEWEQQDRRTPTAVAYLARVHAEDFSKFDADGMPFSRETRASPQCPL